MKISFTAQPQLLDEINRGSNGNVDLQVKYDHVKIELSLVCTVCAHREIIPWDLVVSAAVAICEQHKHLDLNPPVRESVAEIEYIDAPRRYKDVDDGS